MDTSQKIHVKVQYEDETRRFALNSPSFSEFFTVAVRLFNIQTELVPHIATRYQDDESDWITVDKDEEFAFAVSICKSPIKLKLFLKEKAKQQQQAVPTPQPNGEPRCHWGEGRKHMWMAKGHCSINQRIAFIQWRLDSENLDNKDREKLTYRLGKLKEKAQRNALEQTDDKKCKKEWKNQRKWKGKHIKHRIAFIRWQLETNQITDPQEVDRLKQCLEQLIQESNSFEKKMTEETQAESPKEVVVPASTLRAELGQIREELLVRRAVVEASNKELQQLKQEKTRLDTREPKDKVAILAMKLRIEEAKKKVQEKKLDVQSLNKRANEIKAQLGFGKRM